MLFISSFSNNTIEFDYSRYVFWYQLKFVNLFGRMAPLAIKEFVVNSNDIEIKTLAKSLEPILWLLKYNSLTHFEQNIEIVAADVPTSN